MPNIQIGANAADVQTALDAFNAALKATGQVTGDFTTKTLAFNEAGKLTSAVIEQMNAAGQKLASSFDVTATSIDRAGAKITGVANAFKNQLQAMAAASGEAAARGARNIFPLPSDASVGRILSYNTSINNLQRAVAGAGLSSIELDNIFRRAASGTEAFARSMDQMPAKARDVAQALLQVANQAQTAGRDGERAARLFGLSWQDVLRIFEANIFRRGLNILLNSIRDGVISALSYQVQLQQVANVAGQTGTKFEGFARQVRTLSEGFAIPISEGLAASQSALTSQFGDTAAGLNVLRNAMRLTVATGTDLDSSTKLLTTTMQAFRLGSEDAGRVANIFYTAAQRSRVPIEELKNAIGRVSQTADGLGISLEQTTALFLTVAQQGGRPTEAFSLLNQVLGRVLQPTKELQQFLNDLGTPTGRLAIQTFGLVGFLERLNEAARTTPGRLGDIGGSVRTLRGLMALTGDQTQIFQQNLDNLGRSSGGLAAGQQRVNETPAQRARAEVERLRNTFTVDIGSALINNLARVVDAFGGAKATVVAMVEAMKSLVAATIVYKGLLQAIPTLTGLAESIGLAGRATQALATGAPLITAVATAVFLLVTSYRSLTVAQEAALTDRVNQRIAREGEAINLAQERVRAAGRAEQEQTAQLVASAYQARLRQAADAVRLSQQAKDAQVEHQKQVADAFRQAGQVFTDNLRNQLAESRRAVNDAVSELQTRRRELQGIPEQFAEAGFQRRLGAEQNPDVAIGLIQRRIAEQMAEAQRILSDPRSTREQADTAVQMLRNVDRLNGELFNQERRRAEIIAEQTNSYTLQVQQGRIVRALFINMSADEQRRAELTEQVNSLLRQRSQIVEENRRKEEQSVATQQVRLRLFESLLRDAEQLKLLNEQGDLQPRFADAERQQRGGARALLERELRELGQSLSNAARQQGVDYRELEPLFERRRRSLEAELAAHQRVTDEQRRQTQLAEQQTQDTTNRSDLINQRTATLQRLLAQSGEISAAVDRAGRGVPRQLEEGVAERFFSPDSLPVLRAARDTLNEYREAIVAARRAQEAFRNTQSPETTQRLSDALDVLAGKAERVAQLQGGTARRAGASEQTPEDARRLLDSLRRPGGEAGDAIERLRGAFGRGGEISNINGQILSMEERLRGVSGLFGEIGTTINDRLGPPAENNVAAIGRQIGQSAFNAQSLTGQLDNIIDRLRTASSIGFPTVPVLNLGNPERKAHGGYIGPRGSDIIPAWLSPGEYVMDAMNTRKFYSQLLSMSQGVQPRYMAGGGPVSVGDIHVSVQGGATNEKTVRDLGNALNREIRRGTIRWRNN